ncbi:hypothetical protein TB1_024927 [Malus domestica]
MVMEAGFSMLRSEQVEIGVPLNCFSEARAVEHVRVLAQEIDDRQVHKCQCIVLVSPEVSDVSSKLGSFFHGFTYSGHSVDCAVAIQALKT